MIAVDTSIWIRFFEGDSGADVKVLDSALQDRQVLMVPVVLAEMLSDPKLPSEVSQTGRKARLGDALIAQCCIDRGIPLLTRDRDFRAFARAAGLNLVIGSATE